MNLYEPYVAYDTETTGLNIYKGARPFMYIMTFDTNHISIEHDSNDYIEDWYNLRTIVTKDYRKLQPVLENPAIAKVAHNMKFDQLMSHSRGIKLKGTTHCTLIAKHLCDENSRNSLEEAGQQFVFHKYKVKKENKALEDWFTENKVPKTKRRYDKVPEPLMMEYAASDGLTCYLLWNELRAILHSENLINLYAQEIKLKDELIRTYLRGVPIDLDYTTRCKYEMQAELYNLEDSIYGTVGYEFNINSGRDLAKFLIQEGYNLPYTDKGNVKTDKATIEAIDHPLIAEVLKYRRTTKMLSTYIENFLSSNVKGVIHCDLNQCGPVTGRFSCSDPNLQTIPKPKKDPRIGRCFTGRPGYVTFAIDWEQMEYRMFLAYSKELELIAMVNNENADFHKLIMSKVPLLKSRDDAKTFNFMVLYGGGEVKIADKLDTDRMTARAIKKMFFNNLPNSRNFMQQVEIAIANRGYVFNKYGRRRRLRSSESYKAVNALIQGVCADYVKEKMIKVAEFIRPYGGFITLQVHDELHIEIPEDKVSILPDICAIMEDSMDMFGIKLTVDPAMYNPSWGMKVKIDRHTRQPIVNEEQQQVKQEQQQVKQEVKAVESLYDW